MLKTEVTCLNCGWVHMALSRAEAESSVVRFNAYFYSLPEEQREEFYGGKPSTIRQYECCSSCGGSYKNFRTTRPGDAPDGVTISPIISADD